MNDKPTGRPKKQQSRPLIFQRIRSKVTRQLCMSASTAENLERYINWACKAEGAEKDEAQILTIDQALGEFFKRDKLFLDTLEDKTNPEIATTSTPPRASGVGI